jgi:hypothetical protein
MPGGRKVTCSEFGALVTIKCTWHDTRRVNMLSAVGNTGVAEIGLTSRSGN